jgi:Erythromycin esterase
MPSLLERAIGVIYRPEAEGLSHSVRARLPDQFDAVLHIDETHVLEPLERWSRDVVDFRPRDLTSRNTGSSHACL